MKRRREKKSNIAGSGSPVVGHIKGFKSNPTFHTVQMGNGALFVTGRLKRGIRKAGGGDEEGKGKLVVFCNHLILTNLKRAKKKIAPNLIPFSTTKQ